MGVERERSTGAGWRAGASPAFLAVIVVGLLSLALILWTDRLWRESYRRTVPLLDNLMLARDSLAEGHLWMHGLLRGNPGIDAEMVADAYEQAVAAVEDAIQGRSAIRDLPGAAPQDPALLEELGKYRQLSQRTQEMARTRWAQTARGERSAIPDVQLDTAEHALGLLARGINVRLQDDIREVIDTQRGLRNLCLGLWAALLVGLSWALHVAGRRRVRAEEGLREAQSDLEHTVEERTAELVAANANLQSEIEDRKEAEAALGRSEKELRFLSSQLLTFQEDERTRLARELHDGIVQTLSAILFRVERTLRSAGSDGGDAAAESDDSAVRMLQGVMGDVRKLYMDLRPTMLDDLGLVSAAEWFCRQFREAFPGIRVTCEWSLEEADVPAPLKIVVYRIIQECLSNVGRHSRAHTATVCLSRSGEQLELTVEDDGVGFDAGQALSLEVGDYKGLGLGSMRHRVEATGGAFTVESSAGAGTHVRAVWPLR